MVSNPLAETVKKNPTIPTIPLNLSVSSCQYSCQLVQAARVVPGSCENVVVLTNFLEKRHELPIKFHVGTCRVRDNSKVKSRELGSY